MNRAADDCSSGIDALALDRTHRLAGCICEIERGGLQVLTIREVEGCPVHRLAPAPAALVAMRPHSGWCDNIGGECLPAFSCATLGCRATRGR